MNFKAEYVTPRSLAGKTKDFSKSLTAMLPSNMAANTNHATSLKNQSAIKYLPYMRFLSNFGCKISFMCSINFWHQQDYNSLFKGNIDHVTS